MRNITGLIPRDLIALVLVASVSMCCCHVRQIAAAATTEEAACTTETSCCCQPAPETDDERKGPGECCEFCNCVKGTGLKDDTSLVAHGGVPPLAIADVVTVGRDQFRTSEHRPTERRPRLDAPTLLRMRCALVV